MKIRNSLKEYFKGMHTDNIILEFHFPDNAIYSCGLDMSIFSIKVSNKIFHIDNLSTINRDYLYCGPLNCNKIAIEYLDTIDDNFPLIYYIVRFIEKDEDIFQDIYSNSIIIDIDTNKKYEIIHEWFKKPKLVEIKEDIK